MDPRKLAEKCFKKWRTTTCALDKKTWHMIETTWMGGQKVYFKAISRGESLIYYNN